MSKPAARSLLDTAGHVGPITTGSPNVLIGGAPAARKGDSFICIDPSHGGSGVIIGGSKTVLINGVSAARMGDITDCAAVPVPPPVVSGGAPAQVYNATYAKNTNKDGTIKTSNPNLKAKAFYTEFSKKDKNGDSGYDHVAGKAVVSETSLRNGYTTEGGYDVVSGGTDITILAAEGEAGAYGSNGTYGGEAKAGVAVAKGSVDIAVGDSETFNVTGKAQGELASAEAKGNAELYTGGDAKQYGFNVGAGAEAQMVKGEIEGGSNNPLFEASAKISGTAASIGATGEGLAYLDMDDQYARVKIGGELALLLGVGADVDLKLKWGWIPDSYKAIKNIVEPPKPILYGGTVISGTPTVLIGG